MNNLSFNWEQKQKTQCFVSNNSKQKKNKYLFVNVASFNKIIIINYIKRRYKRKKELKNNFFFIYWVACSGRERERE